MRLAWQDGAFLRVRLQEQLVLIQDIEGVSVDEKRRIQALQMAWDNGVFLKRDFKLQQALLERLVRWELDKQQNGAKLPIS